MEKPRLFLLAIEIIVVVRQISCLGYIAYADFLTEALLLLSLFVHVYGMLFEVILSICLTAFAVVASTVEPA